MLNLFINKFSKVYAVFCCLLCILNSIRKRVFFRKSIIKCDVEFRTQNMREVLLPFK